MNRKKILKRTSWVKVSRFFWDLSKIKDENILRKSLVLRPILMGIFWISLANFFTWLYWAFKYTENFNWYSKLGGLLTVLIFVILPLGLLKIISLGYPSTAASILILMLYLATLSMNLNYGVEVPEGILIYALLIVIASVLLEQKYLVGLFVLVSLTLLTIFRLQEIDIFKISSDWKNESFRLLDIVTLVLTYFVIMIISWLSNKQIKISIEKSKESEKKALILAKKIEKQNNNLEKIVENRTRELREYQLKQLTQVNNFAEYGKLAAGLLHDIKNPLTVIAINLDNIKRINKQTLREKNINLENLISKSLLAIKTVESVIKTSSRQLFYEDNLKRFNIVEEIKNTLELLEHRTNKNRIMIICKADNRIEIVGYPIKFSRIVANLINNSIDALEKASRDKKIIEIKLKKNKQNLILMIKDNGEGIEKKNQIKLFKEVFSTKLDKKRNGLGLYISQLLVKEYFSGEIYFKSKKGVGSTFYVKIPYEKTNKFKY